VGYALKEKVNEPVSYGQRCSVARRLVEEGKLTISHLIDGINNRVNDEYSAHPTRAFLVRTDGILAVAGWKGPWGLRPALDEIRQWLREFRQTGIEPEQKLPKGKESGKEKGERDKG
jgi:hypothetical protein